MLSMKTESGCLACGTAMVTTTTSEAGRCEYCAKPAAGRTHSDHGQWVCDDCRDRNAIDVISLFCATSTSTAPMHMAQVIFRHPSVEVHGPVHHYIVPAVLLAAYYNALGEPVKKLAALAEAERFAFRAPTSVCTFQGACGAALGTGFFMSLITQPSAISSEEYRLSNLATSGALTMISTVDGPRCCKRAVLLAIDASISFLKARFAVKLERTDDCCESRLLNERCFGSNCPYYPVEA